MNLTAEYAFTRSASVQVRWDNILDKRYSNAYGYNMPGSTVFVNLALRM
jgi:vitamin B12 transporter